MSNITDMDFRYVWRLVPRDDGVATRERVLQWRKKEPLPYEPKWTEWQDVRTEEE